MHSKVFWWCVDCICIFSLEIICPNLVDHANGAVNVNGMNPGDTATYVCISGFELVGADTLTCGSDGMWSPDPPVCRCELSEYLHGPPRWEDFLSGRLCW